MRLEEGIKLDFDDVLIRPKRSTMRSRKEVDTKRRFTFLHSKHSYLGVPIVAANMSTVGTIEMARGLDRYDMFTCLHKFVDETKMPALTVFKYSPTIGIKDDEYEEFKRLHSSMNFKYLTIDVANGYTERFLTRVGQVRKEFPQLTIIAGNVVTPEMVEELLLTGADVVKVGIGSGAACTTRLMAGVGVPQLSAVIECADAAHGLKGHIMSDGGCRYPADIVKAFAAGADFVMIGGMLAGHKECGGEITGLEKKLKGDVVVSHDLLNGSNFTYDGRTVDRFAPDEWYDWIPSDESKMIFYGMSSKTAQENFGQRNSYRSSEGRTIMVPYKPSLDYTIQSILGGIRSACTYVGAVSLKELTKRTTFVQVRNTHNDFFEKETVGD